MGTKKKEVIINFKIEPEVREQWNKYCEENRTSSSRELQQFVYSRLRLLNNRLTSSRGHLHNQFSKR